MIRVRTSTSIQSRRCASARHPSSQTRCWPLACASCTVRRHHRSLREDRRHVQERDVRLLRQTVRGVQSGNGSGAIDRGHRPGDQDPIFCTLVPEKRQERTTEGGLVSARAGHRHRPGVRSLRDAGIGVSLFIESEEDARASADLGATCAELHTVTIAMRLSAARRRVVELARLEKAGRAVAGAGCAWPPGTARLRQRWSPCGSAFHGRAETSVTASSRAPCWSEWSAL